MQTEYYISIYLDTRRAKANGNFPVKLRIFTPQPRKQKLYNTKFDFTKKEFNEIWIKPAHRKKEIIELRNELKSIALKADEVAKKISPFDFVQFEKKYLRKNGAGNDIYFHYEQAKEKFRAYNSYGTASNYEFALKSFKEFIKHTKGHEPVTLPFATITPDWLQKYENYMITENKRSRTTVSMYVRTLRTIFNNAISEKEIESNIYPFGKGKYQPPTVRNVKKALSKENLKKLFKAIPNTPEQIRAKDFWFFSFACNGMNIKDIALLKHDNIQEDIIIFYRAKTINTSKTDLKPVTVYLTKYSKEIIKKYGKSEIDKNEYLFSIISNNDNEETKHKKIKNFTKFINQNLKLLAKANGITEEISTYWARHSFATSAIRNGASMEFVSESLSHSNLKTTQNYFAGFEDKDKKELMQKLMKF